MLANALQYGDVLVDPNWIMRVSSFFISAGVMSNVECIGGW